MNYKPGRTSIGNTGAHPQQPCVKTGCG